MIVLRLTAALAMTIMVGCSASHGTPPPSISSSGLGDASSIRVESGNNVRLLVADHHGDASSVEAVAVLSRNPSTTCLTDGTYPLVLPVGTTLQGSGDDVTVVGPDGSRYRLGDEVSGNGALSSLAEIKADYGTVPEICGPPPWKVLHDELTRFRSSGP
jgi:hypothetical protein